MVALGGSGGGKSFQFEKVGDGFDDAVVVSVTMKQDTSYDDDNEPLVFYKKKPTKISAVPDAILPSCDPVPALWVEVQTSYRNHEGLDKPMADGDDGTRSVVFSKGKFIELKKVTKDVSKGGLLSVRLMNIGKPTKKNFNPPKEFGGGIRYKPPTETVSLGGDDPEEAAPAESSAGKPHGPKPDYLPQEAWDAMPVAERAKLSPF